MRSTTARDGLAGAAAAALALGVSELAAGLLGLPSLIEAVGDWVIDVSPTPVKEWAIDTFGTNDKLVLLIGIVVVALFLGYLVGILARRRFGIAIASFLGFGAAAALAAVRDPEVSLGLAAIPAGLAAITGLATLRWLYDRSPSEEVSPAEPEDEAGEDPSRRRLVIGLGAVLGVAALSGGVGRALVGRSTRTVSGRADVVLPTPVEALAAVPEAAELGVQGLSQVITPNEVFYRIDTAFLGVPRVEIADWVLSIEGRVERPYTISYADLLDMPLIERDVTLSCVSNKVGGDLVGNARWLGVPLADVLDRAGVGDAEQVVGRSVDDFTVGFPIEAVYDGRDALVAVGMNGEPLPMEHGFPARLVVAGLYGYVSATKWLSSIQLTGWEEFDAYWVPRGWAKEAPIKTQSRIDTPTNRAALEPGTHNVAGVAWAPNRGISKVEVQLGEDADWVEARLSEPLSDNCWRQWVVEWDATAGTHRIRVRATDGEGETQTEELRPPAPDGATGWHAVQVSVG
jgi:DMSO/TMAO reductase YedYZ molybdopterin-dependent catalytic subunit